MESDRPGSSEPQIMNRPVSQDTSKTIERHAFESNPQHPLTCKLCGISQHSPYHFPVSDRQAERLPSTPTLGSQAPGSMLTAGQMAASRSLSSIFKMYETEFANLDGFGQSFDELLTPKESDPSWKKMAPMIKGKLSEGDPKEYAAWKKMLQDLNSSVIKNLFPLFLKVEEKIRDMERMLLHPIDGAGHLIPWER